MAALKRESERVGISVAELIRQTMDNHLRARRRSTADPFAGIGGLVRSHETDLAARADEILY